MNSTKPIFPTISPADIQESRPFWSVMITAYKRTSYMKEALESVLRQDPGIGEMQIEVVDDCSPNSEEIEALVKEVGKGRVSFYRQPQNVGIYENWNTCIRRSQGRWIHILSDDDVVLPDFYQVYRDRAEIDQTSVVVAPSVYINEKGKWLSLSPEMQETSGVYEKALWVLSNRNRIHTPGIVVAREAYEKVGGFTSSLLLTPDWEMWVRLAANAPVSCVNRPYSLFRVHSSSETDRLVLSGESVTDCLAVSKIIQSKFDDLSDRKAIARSIEHYISNESFYLSRKLIKKGYCRASLIHANWSFRLAPSVVTLKNLIRTILISAKAKLMKTTM